MDEKSKEVINDIEHLRHICIKIIQAYRIRLMSLKKRHKILSEIERNFENIKNFKRVVKTEWDKENNRFEKILTNENAFYSILETNLKRERRLLEIIRRADVEGESNIVYAIKQIEIYKKRSGEDLQEVMQKERLKGWIRKLSSTDIYKFLTNMGKFLELMREDLLRIENRIVYEEFFLENRDKNHFDEFILAWDDELRANQKLINHFRRILRSNGKIIKLSEKQLMKIHDLRDDRIIYATVLTGLSTAGVSIGLYQGWYPMLPFGLVLVLGGFIHALRVFYSMEYAENKKDSEILRKLENLRAIKISWFRKMLH